MSFLQPWLLLGLLGAAVPILIHLIHKRKPRTHRFAAIELVMRSVERIESKWRLRRLLLLAARVLILAALALAAAGPLLGNNAGTTIAKSGPERLAIVIDASLSMRAVYDGRTAFARALTAARNAIDEMGAEDQLTLVVARSRPQLMFERPTANRSALLDAVKDLEPSYETTELAEALSRAVQGLAPVAPTAGAKPAKQPGYRVLLLTDLARGSLSSGTDLTVPGTEERAHLEIVDVLSEVPAESRTNRGLIDFTAHSVPGRAPRTLELRARAHSYEATESDEVTPLSLELLQDSTELAQAMIELPQGSSGDKRLIHAFDKDGPSNLTVRLEPDRLREDDERYAVYDIKPPVRTLVVDGAPSGLPKDDEVFYLERALHAGARDQPPPRIVTVDDFSRTDLSAFDVIVLAGVDSFARSDGARLVQWVEAGGGLWITTSETVDVELYNSELQAILPRLFRGIKVVDAQRGGVGSGGVVTLGQLDDTHPVMTPFKGDAAGGLLTVKTQAYLLLQPGSKHEMRTWVSYDDGQPALVERSVGRGRVVVLTTSIDRDLSDLPIRPAFLPLVRRTVLYLGGSLTPPDTRRTLVSEAREIRVPAGVEELKVIGPDGTESNFAKSELAQGTLRFEGTSVPGHYKVLVSFTGPAEPLRSENFAVNLDPRESDLRPLVVDEAQELLAQQGQPSSVSASALGSIGRMSPRFLVGMLLLLMALAFVVESGLTALDIGR